MSQEQTALVGEDISVTVNVIDNTGSHVAATIDTTTTRIEGFPATAPTVTTVNAGIYRIVFSGVSPAPAEGDRLVVKINGDIAGTAWTEYGIPVKILANDVSTFDQAVDAVITDAASRTASQANVSGLSTFDPATDTVLNVTNVAVTASNTDMRGTDGVVVPTSDITAIKTKTDQLAFTVANQVDANSLTGGTSPADIWSYATRTITSGGITASEVTDAVWDASISSHNAAGSFGKGFRELREGLVSIDGQVNDAAATSLSFISNLATAVDDYWNGQVIHFISGNLAGQSQVISDYNGTTKTITVEGAFTAAPDDASEFIVLSSHVHPVAEIVDGVWNESQSSYTVSGTFGFNLDSPVSSAGSGGSGLYQVVVTVKNASNEVLQGARINVDGTTLTLTTASDGTVTFNLDSGVYLLECSPPAGYDTPTGNVVTVTSSDTTSEFILTATPSPSCDVPWIG